MNISIVIPTYERGRILVATLEQLFAQSFVPYEILVVDQTDYADGDPVASWLQQQHDVEAIKWLRLAQPSIPHAMNVGLLTAVGDYVLFLDDDIAIARDFLQGHATALHEHDCPAQVGAVLQPGEHYVATELAPEHEFSHTEQRVALVTDLDFSFNGDKPAYVRNCMAGNLLVQRSLATQCGGFDENFLGAAYRFETEFCRRLIEHSQRSFYFAPTAKIDHLKAARGGTRHLANFLTSPSALHSAGDYYFALRCGTPREAFCYCCTRFFRSIVARFYLHKPWYIPVRLVAELRGLFKAIALLKNGSRLLR